MTIPRRHLVLLLTTAGLFGCNTNPPPTASVGNGVGSSAVSRKLVGAGSSLVNPLVTRWAREYTASQVDYTAPGSGAGIREMMDRAIAFGCTDAPMNADELTRANAKYGDVIHVPIALGAVAVVYNLPELKEPLKFSGPLLADIFQAKITRWNDPRLAELNPGVSLPARPISLVTRSDSSGTTYTFVEYLSKAAPDQWSLGVGKSVKWPEQSVGHKGSDGVAGQVSRSVGAIGYVEVAYAVSNKLAHGTVRNQAGYDIGPTAEGVTAAAESLLPAIPADLRFSITDAPGKDAYPISAVVWVVAYAKQPRERAEALKAFLTWAVRDGQAFCKDLHYAPLPEGMFEKIDRVLKKIES